MFLGDYRNKRERDKRGGGEQRQGRRQREKDLENRVSSVLLILIYWDCVYRQNRWFCASVHVFQVLCGSSPAGDTSVIHDFEARGGKKSRL